MKKLLLLAAALISMQAATVAQSQRAATRVNSPIGADSLRQSLDPRADVQHAPPTVIANPCNNSVAYQYKPSLLEGVDPQVLADANAALKAVLEAFHKTEPNDEERIDRQLYERSMQLARLIDEICPDGQCIAPAVEEVDENE